MVSDSCPACKQLIRPIYSYCPSCGIALSGIRISAGSNGAPGLPLQPMSGSRAAAIRAGMLVGGRYRLHALLGAGNMGTVWKAGDERLRNRSCAVKQVALAGATAAERAWFEREAETLAGLSHPGICDIRDRFEEDGNGYLVLELIPGRTLAEEIAGRGSPGLPEGEVLAWARQLGDVLAHLHGQIPAIIFRDVKPQNIIRRDDGRVALIDFGIARPVVATGGTTIGTAGYAPPEQYQGIVDPRADQYALAATLHHLLTGRDPTQQTPFQFPSARGLVPSLSPVVDAALARASSMRVDDRYASMVDFIAALSPSSAKQPDIAVKRTHPASSMLRSLAAPEGQVPAQPSPAGQPGQGTIKMQTSRTRQNLTGVALAGRQMAWAVGINGTILRTTDGGAIWTVQASPSDAGHLFKVAFAGEQTGWAVGSTILHTIDGGAAWNVQSSDTDRRHTGVACIDGQTAWVVGERGAIRHTMDGGAVWKVQTSRTRQNLKNVVFIDARIGWIVGDYGTILHTMDGGAIWKVQTSNTRQNLKGMAFAGGQTGWAVGINGTILHTADGGAIWKDQASGTVQTLWSVAFVDAQSGWTVGDYGTILHTTDGGATWKAQTSRTVQHLCEVAFADGQTGWAVGFGGTILHTADGGATWKVQA